MSDILNKENRRKFRHIRLRKRLKGIISRPRLRVHRSLTNFYAQIVDDTNGKVLLGASTLNKDLKNKIKFGGNIKAAETFGEFFASEAIKKGIKQVCFDRGGYLYHGRVKAFADAARKAGMEF